MDPEKLFIFLSSTEGFDWDEGNAEKNRKHSVEQVEIEQVFFDPDLLIVPDFKHSRVEHRSIAYGTTQTGRVLTVVFTVRGRKIRPISGRDANRKERERYEEKET